MLFSVILLLTVTSCVNDGVSISSPANESIIKADPTTLYESHLPVTLSLTVDDCVGLWRKAPNEMEGFTKVYHFADTKEFQCFEREAVSYGQWSLENDVIILKFDDNDMSESLVAGTTSRYGVSGLILNGELYVDLEKEHIYFQSLDDDIKNAVDFSGEWNRTNVVRAESAVLRIHSQTDSEFQFDIEAIWDAHIGTMSDTVHIIAPNQGYCYIAPEYSDNYGVLLFTLIDNVLCIEYDGSILALEFGANVSAHGAYTKGDPIYVNTNIIDETLITAKIRERMRSLVGDKAYEQIIYVMEYGHQYTAEEFTYSGFIGGIGVGVDFSIRDDGKIYCLGYYLDGPGYTFYTNDPEYRDRLPDWIQIQRSEYELSFVYKDV